MNMHICPKKWSWFLLLFVMNLHIYVCVYAKYIRTQRLFELHCFLSDNYALINKQRVQINSYISFINDKKTHFLFDTSKYSLNTLGDGIELNWLSFAMELYSYKVINSLFLPICFPALVDWGGSDLAKTYFINSLYSICIYQHFKGV